MENIDKKNIICDVFICLNGRFTRSFLICQKLVHSEYNFFTKALSWQYKNFIEALRELGTQSNIYILATLKKIILVYYYVNVK